MNEESEDERADHEERLAAIAADPALDVAEVHRLEDKLAASWDAMLSSAIEDAMVLEKRGDVNAARALLDERAEGWIRKYGYLGSAVALDCGTDGYPLDDGEGVEAVVSYAYGDQGDGTRDLVRLLGLRMTKRMLGFEREELWPTGGPGLAHGRR